jgi:hypothetical protein
MLVALGEAPVRRVRVTPMRIGLYPCGRRLRRRFALAQEWRVVNVVLPKVRLLPGENHRLRVLTPAEEELYLAAAEQIGPQIEDDYRRALIGVRAQHRARQPIPPDDPYRPLHVTIVLFELALRPEEASRLP